MSGVNKHIIVGRLGADPKIRATQSGAKVAEFSVATDETWRDKSTGERRQATEWHRVVIFAEGLVKVVEQYVKKGARVYVEGPSKTRKYTPRDGIERSVTEIVLSGFGSQLVLLERREGAPPPASEDDYGAGGGSDAAPPDDDIPFA
jgi:single-strand DNA-binding protein